MSIVLYSKGYVKNKQASKAIDLFQQIENPNEVVLMVVLNACAQLQTDAALTLVKNISSDLFESDAWNPQLVTSQLDALMKCGDVKFAESIFNELNNKTLEMYNAILSGDVHDWFFRFHEV